MDSLTIWIVILAIGTGTFLLRFTMVALVGKVSLPEKLFDALQYLPPAIFAALVIPAIYPWFATAPKGETGYSS